jgi:hypothetical protein
MKIMSVLSIRDKDCSPAQRSQMSEREPSSAALYGTNGVICSGKCLDRPTCVCFCCRRKKPQEYFSPLSGPVWEPKHCVWFVGIYGLAADGMGRLFQSFPSPSVFYLNVPITPDSRVLHTTSSSLPCQFHVLTNWPLLRHYFTSSSHHMNSRHYNYKFSLSTRPPIQTTKIHLKCHFLYAK